MEEKLKILLCEDDENLGMLLREYLQAKNFECKLCPDGEIGYREFFKEKYDICVLDVMMPKKDGFTLAQEIRQSNAEVPIIFLTAKTLKEDILEGFKLGADDYITKPFSMREVAARVRTNMRRAAAAAPAPAEEPEADLLRVKDLVIDRSRHAVYKDGKELELTQREYELIRFLAENPGKVVSREELMTQVWRYDYFGDLRAVDVAVRRLREKLEPNPSDPQYVVTKRGVGYYFAD